MDTNTSTSNADVGEDKKAGGSSCNLQPIIIDGGCMCQLVRYRITIPVDFQQTELYDKVVGFSHCYCHACRTAVSALTRTRLKIPRDMVQRFSRGKLIKQESSKCAVSPENSENESTSDLENKTRPEPTQTLKSKLIHPLEPAGRYQYQKGISPTHGKVQKPRTTLEAIQQDPNLEEEEPFGTDTAYGCCCDDEDEEPSILVAEDRRPSLIKLPWSGSGGYHRRIWKRGRGVGGKEKSSAGVSPHSLTSTVATGIGTDEDVSPGDSPLTQSSEIEGPFKTTEDKGKGKAKIGLWSRMRGKASIVISPKDKDKTNMTATLPPVLAPTLESTIQLSATGQKDIQATTTDGEACPETSPPPPSSLDVLRWESRLDQQCPNSDSDSDSDCSDPCRKALRIPWPFKEYSLSTRDGRTSYNGFCVYCGGSLTYRTSVTIHDMMDVLVGSMDDPEQAMQDVGFLAEFHCDLAGSIEDGARLGTQAGHVRDEKVVRVLGCDWEPHKPRESVVDGDKGSVMGYEDDLIDGEMIYDEMT
ncbi:hypothetical protein TWF696_000163 [Orbilia brochopaga]|uniref:Uncharacterized protein n=1 Tax=Orbilia brochopaga TaxID=3140254 RepID=A0AAV9VCY5_9PEZI